jgi:hypothetical protein
VPTQTDRIATTHNLTAMVALDTIHPLAKRITQLLNHGRRITIAHRHATYLNDPPKIHARLVVNGEPRIWDHNWGAGLNVPLTDGSDGPGFWFGIAAFPGGRYDTEAEVWKRYHASKAESDNPFERRRHMTEVRIVGGVEGFGPGRDDRIVIRHWNENGVCDETVIAFDNGNEEET